MNKAEDFYRNRYSTTIAYIVALLLFFLPFVEIRCNNEPFAQNSGIGLAFGTDYKVTGQISAFGNKKIPRNNSIQMSSEKGKLYVSALIALLLGVAGLILSLSNQRRKAVNMILGALAAIALMVVALQMKKDIRDQVGTDDISSSQVKVSLDFTLWYYLSIVSFLAASFFSFKQAEWAKGHKLPPRSAPQIPIKNPGEQSEFPTSPDESEMER